MLPNLFEATQTYWRQLDELEMAYEQGEISIEEVDTQVAFLMKKLGQQRRETISCFRQSVQIWLTQQRETVIGVTVLGLISCLWLSTN